MKLRYLLFFIVVFLSIIPFIHADLGLAKQYSCFNIRVLSNCSSINLTEITNSNTTFTINQAMTKIGGQTFSYSFCNTTQIDRYSFSWNDPCIDCSQGNCGNTFSVTATGQELTIAKAVTYILIFVISLLILIGLLVLGIFLPSNNKRDEMTGYILAVENIKYVKYFSIMFAYLVALFISFFAYSVCYSYLDFNYLTTLFYFVFFGLAVCTLVFFPLMVYLMIANKIRDSQISELLSRGLKTR